MSIDPFFRIKFMLTKFTFHNSPAVVAYCAIIGCLSLRFQKDGNFFSLVAFLLREVGSSCTRLKCEFVVNITYMKLCVNNTLQHFQDYLSGFNLSLFFLRQSCILLCKHDPVMPISFATS
jgi:hypothetical protein